MLKQKQACLGVILHFYKFLLDWIQVSDKFYARKLKSSNAPTLVLYFAIFEGAN